MLSHYSIKFTEALFSLCAVGTMYSVDLTERLRINNDTARDIKIFFLTKKGSVAGPTVPAHSSLKTKLNAENEITGYICCTTEYFAEYVQMPANDSKYPNALSEKIGTNSYDRIHILVITDPQLVVRLGNAFTIAQLYGTLTALPYISPRR